MTLVSLLRAFVNRFDTCTIETPPVRMIADGRRVVCHHADTLLCAGVACQGRDGAVQNSFMPGGMGRPAVASCIFDCIACSAFDLAS